MQFLKLKPEAEPEGAPTTAFVKLKYVLFVNRRGGSQRKAGTAEHKPLCPTPWLLDADADSTRELFCL